MVIAVLVFLVAVESYALFVRFERPGPAKPVSLKKAAPPAKKTTSVNPETAKVFQPIPEKPPTVAPLAQAVPVAPALPTKKRLGRIAIIIDDWGYNANHCENLAEIEEPVTVAILPNLPHSTEIATCAHRHNKEVMLHLPMEPHWNLDKYPQDYIIRISMSRAKVEKLLDQALKSIPYAAGVNNHMGSKATENRRLMAIVFEALQKKRLFFVDSVVTGDSICPEVAQQKGLRFARRDVFLDNQNDRHYIETQFAQLAQLAREKGFAVAIGHDRALTLQIIKEQTKLLADEGFQMITINELIKQP